MGVPGLWDLLRPVGQSRSLTHLAVVDGFENNVSGYRGFRVGIDASIWFFHAAYGREGENPELRTMFFRCSRLLSLPFLPLFVFDGPKRPSIKRNKRVSGNSHWLTNGMKNIIEAFGFEWKTAPGEAEAELAYLNRSGLIDAVLSDDVDTFVFGATMVIRNPSSTLSGNRAHPTKNASGKDDGNHVVIYQAKDFSNADIDLTQGGLILIAILSGGDYHPAGLPRCGPNLAHGLAKCGFGDSLLQAARTMSRRDLSIFLSTWRQSLRDELRTNSRNIIGRKNPSLANSVPDDFPDIDIVLSYTNPIISESEGTTNRNNFVWNKKLDLGRIAHICELYFEWGVRSVIIKRFRTVIWPAAVLRFLREAALVKDGKSIQCEQKDKSSTDRAQQLSSPIMQLPDGSKTIVKILSSRKHPSTDQLLEYRLEIAPESIVRSAEAGIEDTRPPLIEDIDDDDDDEDIPDNSQSSSKKDPLDPYSHLRVWIPACMIQLVEPSMVEDYASGRERKQNQNKAKRPTTITRIISHDPKESSTSLPKDLEEGIIAKARKPKGDNLKTFYAVQKNGGRLNSSRKLKSRPPQTSGENMFPGNSSSDNIRSKVVKALDNTETVKVVHEAPQRRPLECRPFPITFDSDDLFADSELLSKRHEDKLSQSHSDSKQNNPQWKSERQFTEHPSPRAETSRARAQSPCLPQTRVSPSHNSKNDVIEISSDSDAENVSTEISSVAPLVLAKARAKSRAKEYVQKHSSDIIDLT